MGYLREDDIKDITEHVLRRKDFYKKFVFYLTLFFVVIIGPQLVFYALTYFVQ